MSEQQKKSTAGTRFKSVEKSSPRKNWRIYRQTGKDPFVITKYDQTHHSLEIKENFEELAGKKFLSQDV